MIKTIFILVIIYVRNIFYYLINNINNKNILIMEDKLGTFGCPSTKRSVYYHQALFPGRMRNSVS